MSNQWYRGWQTGPLPELRRVLAKWVELTEKYGRTWDWDDATWFYNERAALSLVAAAVWCAGGIALEEFSADKLARPSRRTSRGPYRGRCDLYFSIGGHDFFVEAKPAWQRLRDQPPDRAVERALARAKEAVHKLAPGTEGHRLAMVLIGPMLAAAHENQAQERLRGFVDRLKSRRDCATAWTFPLEARTAFKSEGILWPGAAILLKPLRARNAAR